MPVKAHIDSKPSGPQPDASVPDILVEAAAITALATTGQQAALLANLSFSNSVLQANLSQQNVLRDQHSLDELAVMVTGKAAKLVEGLGVLESKASSEYLTSSALAEQIADLKATMQAFAGGGGPTPPAGKDVFLPSNPLGPPHRAVAPTHLFLTNVASPGDLNVKTNVGETQTILTFTASNPIPLPPLPVRRIPYPIPAAATVYAHVPLQLAYDNDNQTRTVEVSSLTAEKSVSIREKPSITA